MRLVVAASGGFFEESSMINLACVASDKRTVELCTEIARFELESAGIRIVETSPVQGQVPITVIGEFNGWIFYRRWTFWSAETNNTNAMLSMTTAKYLHELKGTEVRANGYSGGIEPDKCWGRKGKADLYNIDTQEGLNIFVNILRHNVNFQF